MSKNTFDFLHFTLSLFDLDQSVSRLKTLYCREAGLKPVHVLWILLLDGHPDGITAARLSSLAHIDKALVSRELKNLFSLGLIERKEPSHSSYNALIILSPKGKEKARLIERITSDFVDRIHELVSQEEMDTFYQVCSVLTTEFNSHLEEISRMDGSILPETDPEPEEQS